jgi:rRNA maturation endonuclease Nob1
MNLALLRLLGFSESEHVPFTRQYRVRCASCEALVINGTPTHERGCPDQMHECHGCNEIIPANQRYCASCA